jgi:sulfur relay protein TusB/DsrH
MLVLIKSAPDTPEGKRALKLARDMAADVCLLQNGVYFGLPERLEGFCGAAYLIKEDARLRGLKPEDLDEGIKEIEYDELIDLMMSEDKVVGIF